MFKRRGKKCYTTLVAAFHRLCKDAAGERTPAALPYCSMKVSYSSRLSWRVSSTMPVHSVTSIEPAKPYP